MKDIELPLKEICFAGATSFAKRLMGTFELARSKIPISDRVCAPLSVDMFRYRRSLTRYVIAFIGLCIGGLVMEQRGLADTLDDYKRGRDQYVDEYRRTGRQDPTVLTKLEPRLAAFANTQTGEARLRAMQELATVIRLEQKFTDAVMLYEKVASEADRTGHRDIAFEAWIGLARAHVYGTRDHGQAERGYDHALASAGATPTAKQMRDLAAYRAQILEARGELDGALVASLEALGRAENPEDRFYGEFDTAGILLDFAGSCDYRKLIDAKTQEDPLADGWGGCRRSVSSANAGYERAKKSAESLGWMGLANLAGQFQRDIGMRLMLINRYADAERMREAGAFEPKAVTDVLVNRNFSAGAFSQGEAAALGSLIEQAVSGGDAGPRNVYLRGVAASIQNDRATALKLFRQAADGLAKERMGLFDAQRRGTVIENRVEIMRDLATTLLAAGQNDAAFDVFESFRSRGLNELIAAFERPDISKQDREWLASVIELEARAAARQVRIRERVIASADFILPDTELQELQDGARKLSSLLADAQHKKKFGNIAFQQAGLKQLQQASNRSRTPILLYWTTATNVVVWIVSPSGDSEVRTVFLPEMVLNDRVQRMVTSARKPDDAGHIDEQAAQQLYLYLIAPFEQWLSGRNLMIVPQGALLDLPFEALIDPQTKKHVVEKWVTSYAPNATLATKILSRNESIGRSMRVIVDQTIPTHEAERLAALKGMKVEIVPSHKVDPSNITQLVGSANIVHVLAHGLADGSDPLLSSLRLTAEHRITAARLLSGPWQNVQVAVLSSCDSGAWTHRISNEIYGFPWALMVAGADNAVVSRWRVDGPSNADWMAWFYGELSKGSSPATAAAHASREMIANGQRHAFYWAAMRVIGR
ncbi:MAG TPA: CHAT domain-containing protein [Bradyrhizobium sp.]|nr:CHAT domain-containing protein [Bradyrhizobium sp.]